MIFLIAGVMVIGWSLFMFAKERCAEVLLFALFSLFFVPFMCISDTEPRVVDNGTYCADIVSLRNREYTETSGGGMFLGWSVSSKGVEQYVVMEKVDNKYMRSYLSAKTTYIVETDEEPHVEYPAIKRTYPKWRCSPWKWGVVEDRHKINGATIHIPTGSVIRKYDGV